MRNQLFQISADTWAALDPDEVRATCLAMKELGIYQLPYPRVDLRLPLDIAAYTALDDHNGQKLDYVHRLVAIGDLIPDDKHPGRLKFNFGPDSWLDVLNLSLEDNIFSTRITIGPHNTKFRRLHARPKYDEHTDAERLSYANALIVLLATRNAVKTVKHCKSVGLGIGKKDRYEYTTTITLPKVLEDHDEGEAKPTGVSRRPHLRRGHQRQQKFGPGYSFARMIWIAPVFVNADPSWVDTRRAYNVSL